MCTAITAVALLSLAVFGLVVARSGFLAKSERVSLLSALALLTVIALANCGVSSCCQASLGASVAAIARFLDFALLPFVAVAALHPFASRSVFRISLVAAAFNVLVEFVSVFFGVTFAVDAAGVVTNGPCYWLYAAINVVVFGCLAIELLRVGKSFDGCDMASLAGVVALGIVGVGMHVANPSSPASIFALCFTIPALIVHYADSQRRGADTILSESSRLSRQRHLAMTALAKRYFSTHLIDFANETLVVVSSNESVEEIMAECEDDMQKVPHFLERIVAENYQDQIRLFSDFATIRQRMTERSSISLEFVSKDRGWCSASFVVVDRADSGDPSSILFTLAVIDEEKRYQAELLSMSVIDPLTGLYNQRAYLEDVTSYGEAGMGDDFVIMSMDVNGLKGINDRLGHAVGDQLLIGAGSCIRQSFARAGRCYRLGGDEFAAILHADSEDFYNMFEAFNALVEKWEHDQIEGMSISSGYAFHADSPELSVQELANQADLFMYAAKRRYYENSNTDRRVL